MIRRAAAHFFHRRRDTDRIALPPDHWGLEYVNHHLFYRGNSLTELTSHLQTPSHVVLEAQLLKNLGDFQSNGCDVFLSYKTNPVPGLLALLHQHGAGAEVVSEFELWLALRLGVPAERIIFNGSAKSDRSLEWAVEHGIHAVHLNHPEEISRLRAIARRSGKSVRVGLRIVGSGWGGQFGFPIANGLALSTLRELLTMPEFVVTTLHCHRGVPMRTRSDIERHIREVLSFCDVSLEATGWTPTCLDLGGSLSIPTVRQLSAGDIKFGWAFVLPALPPDPAATVRPREFTELVSAQLRNHFAKTHRSVPKLVIEPGRALTGNAQFLLTRVLDVRKGHDFDYAIVDAGVSHARIMMDEYHQILPLQRAAKQKLYRVVGPLCHTGDVISRGYRGGELQRGDLLALMDSGAYCIADSSQFSFPRAGVSLVHEDLQVTELRTAETFEDVVHLDKLIDGAAFARSRAFT